MASLIYNSFMDDWGLGNIIPATSTFYMMLVSAGYTPNKETDTTRADVTNEISGTNYTAGGSAISCSVVLTTLSDYCDLVFSGVSWPNVTFIGCVAGVVYNHNGGAPSGDQLVAYVDFGGAFSPSGQNFVFTPSAPLRITN